MLNVGIDIPFMEQIIILLWPCCREFRKIWCRLLAGHSPIACGSIKQRNGFSGIDIQIHVGWHNNVQIASSFQNSRMNN